MRKALCLAVLFPLAAMAAAGADFLGVQNVLRPAEPGGRAATVLSSAPEPGSGGTDVIGRLDTVGGATYDLQTNGPTAARIVFDPGFGIHVAWMFSADAGPGYADRTMRYNYYNLWASPPSWAFNQGPGFMNRGRNVLAARSGFGNLDVNPVSHCAYVSAHRGDTTRATVLRDASPGAGSFQECVGPSGTVWPTIALTGTQRVHAALLLDEGMNNRTRLYYSRVDPWGTWSTPAVLYGTAPFPGFPNYGLAAGKHSQKVAVVWGGKHASAGACVAPHVRRRRSDLVGRNAVAISVHVPPR